METTEVTSANNKVKVSQAKTNNNALRNEATLRAMYTVEYESELHAQG